MTDQHDRERSYTRGLARKGARIRDVRVQIVPLLRPPPDEYGRPGDFRLNGVGPLKLDENGWTPPFPANDELLTSLRSKLALPGDVEQEAADEITAKHQRRAFGERLAGGPSDYIDREAYEEAVRRHSKLAPMGWSAVWWRRELDKPKAMRRGPPTIQAIEELTPAEAIIDPDDAGAQRLADAVSKSLAAHTPGPALDAIGQAVAVAVREVLAAEREAAAKGGRK